MKEWICSVMEPLNREWKFIAKQELVRCKNCAYALFKEGVQLGHIVCTKPFTERWQVEKPNDWFCADGERRTDDA